MGKTVANRKRKLDMTSKLTFNFKDIPGLLRRRILTMMKPRAFIRSQKASKLALKEAKQSSFKFNLSAASVRGYLEISGGIFNDFTALGVRKKGYPNHLTYEYQPVEEDRYKTLNGFIFYKCSIRFPRSPEKVQIILEYLKKYNIRAERVHTLLLDTENIQKTCEILQPRKLALGLTYSPFFDYSLYATSFDVKCISFKNVENCGRIFEHFQRLAKEHEKIKFHCSPKHPYPVDGKMTVADLEHVDAAVQKIVSGRELRLRKFSLISDLHPKQEDVLNIFGKYGVVLQHRDAGPDGAVFIPMNDGRRLLLEFYFEFRGKFRAKMEIF